MASTADILGHARRVLGVDDGRFEPKLEAVIRNAGFEARRVDQLTEDEREQIALVLDRIDHGTHVPFLRANGTFEIRRAAKPPSRSGGRRKLPAKTGRRR